MQTTVNSYMASGLAGQLYGLSNAYDIRTGINNSRKYVLVEVTEANSVVYSVTINGTVFDITSDADATKAEIVTALVADINAGSEPVTAINGTDDLYLQADVANVDFTLAVAGAGAGDLTATVLIEYNQTIPFGVFTCLDTYDRTHASGYSNSRLHLPTLTTDVTGAKGFGISVMTQAVEQANPTSGNVGYEAQSSMSILRKGLIWAIAEQEVQPADPVFARFAATSPEQLGGLRMDADTADASQIPGCYWRTYAAAAGLAVVEINLP